MQMENSENARIRRNRIGPGRREERCEGRDNSNKANIEATHWGRDVPVVEELMPRLTWQEQDTRQGMHHDGVTTCAGGMYLKPQRRRQALGRERASRGIPDVSTHLAGTRHTTKGCIVRASRAGGMCLDPQLNMRESLGFPL